VASSLAADFRRARHQLLCTALLLEEVELCFQEPFPFSPVTSMADDDEKYSAPLNKSKENSNTIKTLFH
jgi:hypothetical protein